MTRQLTLKLALNDSASFENFLSGSNAEPIDRLTRNLTALAAGQAALEPVVFLAGGTGTGKSHLLQASCRVAEEAGLHPRYVPLAQHLALAPAALDQEVIPRLVCLDDIDAIAGDRLWEQALFALWERVRAARGLVVAAARAAPVRLRFALADFASRLAAGPVYPLAALDDVQKLEAIRLRATNRGLSIAEDVARYIVSRYPRDLHSLFALLDRLDQHSLASQRRITIPFLRDLESQ